MALNADEDEDLRVLSQLAPYGDLPARMSARLEELKARDRRTEVREPEIVAQWIPTPRQPIDDD